MNITNNVVTPQTNVGKKKPKVAIYCRLSQEDRNKKTDGDDSESIKNQKIMLEEVANDKGWEIYGIFSDDDFAGTDRNRPGFNKVINLAKERKIDVILCKSQSRFARELEMIETYINGLFIEWGVRFVSITDNIDTSVAGTTVMRQMTGIMDENQIAKQSYDIKAGLQVKRKNGEHTGGLALYGYLKDPNKKGHLIIDPVAADVIREVFSLYNQGMGKTAIARELNNRGIPNPTQYKLQTGIKYKTPKTRLGTLWKYSAITSMLNNEMYIGNMVQGRYGSISYKSKKNKPKPREEWVIVKGTHEPIIDTELWNSVQKKINENFKPFSNGQIGVFAKKCKCEHCGYTLKTSKSHNDRYLRCPTRQVDKSNCDGSFISQKVLERTVLAEINSMIERYLNRDKLEESLILDNIRTEKEKLQKEIIQYQTNIDKKERAIKTSYIDKVNGVITTEQFIKFNEEFKAEKEQSELLLKQKTNELMKFKDEQDILKSKRKLLEKYINVTELSREMMDNLIDYITVGVKDPITKKKPIKIYWKF